MYILYVGWKKHRVDEYDSGSMACISLLQNNTAGIQIVDTRNVTERPKWLKGTPTLIDTGNGEAWTGMEAMLKIHHHIVDEVRKSQKKRDVPASSGPRHEQHAQRPLSTRDEEHVKKEEGNDDEDDMWTSQVNDDDTNDENDTLSTKKLTSDDLARANSARASTMVAPNPREPVPTIQQLKD